MPASLASELRFVASFLAANQFQALSDNCRFHMQVKPDEAEAHEFVARYILWINF
jgi:hypothetical protein